MTPLQQAEIRAGEIRIRLAELGGEPELTDETRAELDTLRHEYTDTERRMAALRIAEPPPKATETRGSAEGRELRDLVGKASLGRMMSGIADDSEGAGADRELRQAHEPSRQLYPVGYVAGKPDRPGRHRRRGRQRATLDSDRISDERRCLLRRGYADGCRG